MLAAARSVACARALESAMSSADICCLPEEDAAEQEASTSAERLGFWGAGREGLGSQGLSRYTFHEFETISEGVEDVDAAEAVEGSVGLGHETGAFASGEDGGEVLDHERGMGALGGMKVGLDAEMQIYSA